MAGRGVYGPSRAGALTAEEQTDAEHDDALQYDEDMALLGRDDRPDTTEDPSRDPGGGCMYPYGAGDADAAAWCECDGGRALHGRAVLGGAGAAGVPGRSGAASGVKGRAVAGGTASAAATHTLSANHPITKCRGTAHHELWSAAGGTWADELTMVAAAGAAAA